MQMTVLGLSNQKKNQPVAIQKWNRIFLKYSKSSAPTKSMIVMFTEARQYHVKRAQNVSYGNDIKATVTQNKFLKYASRSNVK